MRTEHDHLRSLSLRRLRAAFSAFGFKQNGVCYTLHEGDISKFVSLRSWPRLGPESFCFTLDVSVTSRVLVDYSPGFFFNGVDHAHAPIRVRIGWIGGFQRDVWWLIWNEEDCDAAILEVMAAFRENVWPFLSNIRNLSDLSKALRCPPQYNTWPQHLTNWAADVLDGLDPGQVPPPPPVRP